MKGTEKQIKWAEDIKATMIAALNSDFVNPNEEARKVSVKMIESLNAVDNAGMIIEMFSDVRPGSDAEVAQRIMTAIRVNPAAVKWFKAIKF